MRITNRGITVSLIVVLFVMLGLLMLMGDPCDTASDPQQCRISLPER